MAAEVDRSTGRAMSCPVDVVVVGRSAMTAAGALTRIASFEAAWSRFRPDSEIARLNAASGTPVGVSAPTCRLVAALVEAWYLTDGAFDPTLLVPLVELGYAASRDDATLRTSLPTHGAQRGRPDRVLVDPTRSTVQLPTGTVLDPGGLGKGLAADLVVEELLASGASGALVSIGGDLRVAGEPPDGDAWTPVWERRPNQVIAAALRHSALTTEQRQCVVDFVARPCIAIRREVGSRHARRQVECEDHTFGLLEPRLREPLPGRAGEREGGRDPCR